MAIKEITNVFFGSIKGLTIDNSYDLYVLNSLVKFYEENKIEYLHSQDYDLSYLNRFPDIKFLSISDEAVNFDALNNLTELIGLSVFSSQLSNISFAILENLEYLEIIFNDNITLDFSLFKSLKKIRISDLPHKEISIPQKIEMLELYCCKKITDLDFLKDSENLRQIKLNYLSKLENIESLKKLSKTLEILDIWDCKKIKNIEETMQTLDNLKELQIITTTTDSKFRFSSLAFMKSMVKLESFASNYKIEDGKLNALLNLKNVNITAFYNNYNLRDKDLPHTSVLIIDNGIGKRVKFDSLALGKEDKRIVWLN